MSNFAKRQLLSKEDLEEIVSPWTIAFRVLIYVKNYETKHRCNRNITPEQKVKKGEYVSAYKDKHFVMKWKDKKDIFLMSTTHDECQR